jgi:hypothetical protein
MGRRRLPTPEKYCERCGVRLERRPLASGYEEPLYWFNKRKYCSVTCSNAAIAEKKLQSPVLTEKNGRQRARKMKPPAPCNVCGKGGRTWVHHKDENPLNNSPENLVRLCMSCHVKQHRTRASCVVCGMPMKAKGLCQHHYTIYRYAERRGKELPEALRLALERQTELNA